MWLDGWEVRSNDNNNGDRLHYRHLDIKRWFLLGKKGNCILSNVDALLHVGIVVSALV